MTVALVVELICSEVNHVAVGQLQVVLHDAELLAARLVAIRGQGDALAGHGRGQGDDIGGRLAVECEAVSIMAGSCARKSADQLVRK
jgi:hypothetical protein